VAAVAGDLTVVGFDDVPEIGSFIPPLTLSDRTATPWVSGH
jgi:DNA-binding LacI/PurR family transcriptional regulator